MRVLVRRRGKGRAISLAAAGMVVAAGVTLWTGCDDGGGGSPPDVGDNDPNVVVAMGDSITAGGYPGVLAGITGKRVVDTGVGGTTAANGAAAVSGTVGRYQPGYVCILYGANDVIDGIPLEETISSLRSIIHVVRANMSVPVIGTVTPMSGDYAVFNPAVEALNGEIRGLASSEGTRLTDLYGKFRGRESQLLSDGLHPTPVGDSVIAGGFGDHIN